MMESTIILYAGVLARLCKLLSDMLTKAFLMSQPPEMLKRMVPFNTSFKSNSKRQVIHSYHRFFTSTIYS